jgi:hypothetical protein
MESLTPAPKEFLPCQSWSICKGDRRHSQRECDQPVFLLLNWAITGAFSEVRSPKKSPLRKECIRGEIDFNSD